MLFTPNVLLPSASGISPEAAAFLARTTGLSATERSAYIALIDGLVSDGVWSLLDILYIFATNTQTTALLNLINTSYTGTTHGTVSFTADQGYTGDGATFYIDTGWKPTDGPNFSQNSAAFGIYDLTNSTTADSSLSMGQDALANYDMGLFVDDLVFGLRYYVSTAGTFVAAANGQRQGQYGVVRTSSSASAAYKNESVTPIASSNVDTSAALSAANIFIFANNSSTPTAFTTDEFSAAWAGGGLSAAQVLQVENRINGYMTALGINVY